MRKFKGIFVVLIAFLCLFPLFLTVSKADSAPVQFIGNGVTTHDNKGIILTKEDLTINVNEKPCPSNSEYDAEQDCSLYAVQADFYFSNPNDALDLGIFFPINNSERAFHLQMPWVNKYFEINMNGTAISKFDEITMPSKESEFDYSKSLFTNVHFQKGSNKMIVKYKYPLTDRDKVPNKSFQYILTSGALWAGTIGELNIYVQFPRAIGSSQYETNYIFTNVSPKVLKTTLKDIDPTVELNFDFYPVDFLNFMSPLMNNSSSLSLDQRLAYTTNALNYYRRGYDYFGSSSDIYAKTLMNNDIHMISHYPDYKFSDDLYHTYKNYVELSNNIKYPSQCTTNSDEKDKFDSNKEKASILLQTYYKASDRQKILNDLNNLKCEIKNETISITPSEIEQSSTPRSISPKIQTTQPNQLTITSNEFSSTTVLTGIGILLILFALNLSAYFFRRSNIHLIKLFVEIFITKRKSISSAQKENSYDPAIKNDKVG